MSLETKNAHIYLEGQAVFQTVQIINEKNYFVNQQWQFINSGGMLQGAVFSAISFFVFNSHMKNFNFSSFLFVSNHFRIHLSLTKILKFQFLLS